MTFSKDLSLGWILLVLAAFTVTACRVEDKADRYSSSSTNDLQSVPSDTDTSYACAQALGVNVTTTTPRLPESGGVARFTVTITTLIGLSESWVEIRVPEGVSMPEGYPLNVGLVVGEPYQHSFELNLPPGAARHDVVAGVSAVQGGVDLAQFNNAWVSVGDVVEEVPVLSKSGSRLVREVRFGDSLRRDGR